MLRKLVRVALVVLALVAVLGGGCVAYVSLTYERDFGSTPLPAITASTDPKVIEHGAYVANAVAHCSACHGNGEYTRKHDLPPDPKDLRGGYAIEAGPFGTFYPSNLTPDRLTGIGARTDGEIARTIRHGVDASGKLAPLMRIAVGPMADEDLTAVVSYLRSLPPIESKTPRDEWGFVAKLLAGKFQPRSADFPKYVPPGEPSVERGHYLANGPAACASCHTPLDPMKGFAPSGPIFSGAAEPEPDRFDPEYEIIAPNLTPEPTTGVLASYTEDGFVEKFQRGKRATKGTNMPWANFAQMTDADLRSIYRYLRTVPPVTRVVGPSFRKRGWKPSAG